MNNLKELVNKIYTDLQQSDWIQQYPDLTEKGFVGDVIQGIALDMIPNFVEKRRLEEFVEVSEEHYNEKTFKKYIDNYSEFLERVEAEFYNGLIAGLVGE